MLILVVCCGLHTLMVMMVALATYKKNGRCCVVEMAKIDYKL